MTFGPIYEVADATYIVKPGSTVTNFASIDQAGVKVAAVNNTTTMRGAIAHLKNAKVTGYQTYDEIFNLLKNGEVDAFALSRDQLNAMAKNIPGTRVLDETFKQTVTAVAVPLNHPLSAAFATKFMTEATANGALRKAYDNNGRRPSHGSVRAVWAICPNRRHGVRQAGATATAKSMQFQAVSLRSAVGTSIAFGCTSQ